MKKAALILLTTVFVSSICFPSFVWAESYPSEGLSSRTPAQGPSDDALPKEDSETAKPGDLEPSQEEVPPTLDESAGESEETLGSESDDGKTATGESADGPAAPEGDAAHKDVSLFTLSPLRDSMPQVSAIRTALSETKILDIVSAAVSDSARVQIYEENSTGAQRFQLKDAGGGYYIVANVNSGKVLDVQSANTANGTPVQQYSANGTDAQLWRFAPAGDGSYFIESKLMENLVLDVQWGIAENGVPLQVYEANNSAAQRFYLDGFEEIVSSGLYTVGSLATDTVLDISAANTSNGANVQMYKANQTAAQAFSLRYDKATGYYEIATFSQGKVLDVVGGGKAPGTNVWQYESNGTMAQRWSIQPAKNGSGFVVASACSGLALDIAGADRANGANVQTYTFNNTAAQTWLFRPHSDVPVDPPSSLAGGLYSIRTMLNVDFSLDVAAADTADGANVQLYSFNNTWAQKFKVEQQLGGYCVIRALHSGKVIEVASASAQNCTNVQQNSYSGSDVQLWKPVSHGEGVYSFQSKSSGLYLDVSNATAKNGANVWVYEGNGSTAQRFRLTEIDTSTGMTEGSYVIKSKVGETAIDIIAASAANGAKAQLHESNGTFAQKFKLLSGGDWQYYLVNVHSSKYLDVDTGTKATLQQWDRTQAINQKWVFCPVGEGQKFFYIKSPYTDQYLTNKSGILSLSAYVGDDNQMFALEQTSAFKVYLDAGHGYNSNGNGRIDSGAVSQGYQEYQLTADLVARIGRELNSRGVEYYVGYGKAYWERHQDAVNMGCSTFVSVHFNSSGGIGRGTESFIHSYNAAAGSPVFQDTLHRYLLEGTGLVDRGKKKDEFAVCGGRLPSVLCEIAFIDNMSDMVTYNIRRESVATFVAAGIQEASKSNVCGWY